MRGKESTLLGLYVETELAMMACHLKKKLKKVQRRFAAERIGVYKGIPITSLWKDNKFVSLISSYVGLLPTTKARRYCRAENKKIEIDCPNVITEYNRFMGGVDLLGSHIGCCKIKMKSQKWTMRVFYHYLDMMVINSWLIYKNVMKKKGLPVLEQRPFRIEVAQCLAKMGTNSVSPNKRGRPTISPVQKKRSRVSVIPPNAIQLDGVGHLFQYSIH